MQRTETVTNSNASELKKDNCSASIVEAFSTTPTPTGTIQNEITFTSPITTIQNENTESNYTLLVEQSTTSTAAVGPPFIDSVATDKSEFDAEQFPIMKVKKTNNISGESRESTTLVYSTLDTTLTTETANVSGSTIGMMNSDTEAIVKNSISQQNDSAKLESNLEAEIKTNASNTNTATDTSGMKVVTSLDRMAHFLLWERMKETLLENTFILWY